ncbi:MAG: hypothetical protein IJS65_03965 [Clostridia bacterium]|nr:hypothetical protein [Clostridia bacterium]
MIKVIMGLRGSGKTQKIIDLVNTAVNEEAGNVVVVEKGENLRFNIKYSAKLINIEEYKLALSYDTLYAFVCGLYSGNYDITHIFIDGLYRLANDSDEKHAAEFLEKLEAFAKGAGVSVTVTVSGEAETASSELKKYF